MLIKKLDIEKISPMSSLKSISNFLLTKLLKEKNWSMKKETYLKQLEIIYVLDFEDKCLTKNQLFINYSVKNLHLNLII